ncbi:MAG TPA: H(+)/Cl(-) exchange transporter ClcA [Cyanobacteria bacterium UBA8530]|nr:H(+)/Cl(-) exchange transporter ClcA [Cyanobacteria bacterium UBA8530]
MSFRRLKRAIQALGSPEHSGTLALLQALIIGLFAGGVTVLFRWTMGTIGTWRNAVGLHPLAWWQWLILPAIGFVGGAIAGHLTVHFAPEAKGSGIPQIKQALAYPVKPMRRRTIWVKFLGAAIAIGSGLSLGREGPTVQIGGGIGDWVSRWFPHSRHERRRLMAAGAGAGLAAAFNSPIAGLVFSVEELLKNFSTHTLSTAILATVTASIVSRSLAGNLYSFHLPMTSFHLRELPFYLILGLLGGGLGVLFIKGILGSLDCYQKIPRLPRAWHPAIAGALTGMVGWWLPAAIGGGHDLAELAFNAQILGWMIPIFLLVKFLLTLLAYGSGSPGGIFAPTLVMGAVLGAGVGQLSNLVTGEGNSAVASFAFVGMGALFTAVARAPITAIIIVFELTGNYDQVLPLMLACVTANLVAFGLKGVSIYDALLEREGVSLNEGTFHEEMETSSVEDVMTREAECLDVDETIAIARQRFLETGHGGFPVCANGHLVGLVTRSDLVLAGEPDAKIKSVMSEPPITITGETPLEIAWQLLSDYEIGRLIVVDRDARTLPVGILTRSDLLKGTKRA